MGKLNLNLSFALQTYTNIQGNRIPMFLVLFKTLSYIILLFYIYVDKLLHYTGWLQRLYSLSIVDTAFILLCFVS